MSLTAVKVGIRDVAREACVSVSTVSKVLNPRSSSAISISQGTRDKVLAAARLLHYSPSYGATLLRGKKTKTIGFITNLPGEFGSTCISQYQMRILNGISAQAQTKGYQLLLITSGDYASYLDIKRVDAMIIVNFRLQSNARKQEMLNMYRTFNQQRQPYVVINNSTQDFPIPSVNVDNDYGMKLVADHILTMGYETVGFVGSITENPQHHHLVRFDALQHALTEAGRPISPALALLGPDCGIRPIPRTGSFDHQDGMTAVDYLHRTNSLPRCLVCGNDDVAQGVICKAAQLGISIPQQLAVIGFDNQPGSEFWNPPLTTVRQPLEEMGQQACDFLLQNIEQPDCNRHITVKPTFIQRISG